MSNQDLMVTNANVPALIDTETGLAPVRYGVYDIDIEIWRHDQWIPTFLSQVKPNEFFQIITNRMAGRCFICRGPVIRVKNTYQPHNPNILTQGLEIVTMPESEVQQPLMLSDPVTVVTAIEHATDVEDVVFIESPTFKKLN